MSKRRDAAAAVKAMIAAAIPGQDVRGLANDAARPTAIPPNGLVIVRPGTMGEPDVDLNPLTYHYQHRIPVELAWMPQAGQDADAIVDAMLEAIGAAVAADRTLGGAVEFLDVTEPEVGDIAAAGTATAAGATFEVVAHYSTSSPLN